MLPSAWFCGPGTLDRSRAARSPSPPNCAALPPGSISRRGASSSALGAWDLGDSRCRIDLNAGGRNGTGAVTQVLDAFEFLASGLSSAASGVLTRGKLVWTSGVNNGLAVEIKAHSSSAGVSRIAIALPIGAPLRSATPSARRRAATGPSLPAGIASPTQSTSAASRTCRAPISRCPIRTRVPETTAARSHDDPRNHHRRGAFVDRHALSPSGGCFDGSIHYMTINIAIRYSALDFRHNGSRSAGCQKSSCVSHVNSA